jgi:hypothetical protein
MPAPTSYTMDTFEDYLKYEVLQETAFSLGWATDIPLEPVTWNVILESAEENAKTIKVRPLKYPIAQGTVLEFRHRETNVLKGSVTLREHAYPDSDFLVTKEEWTFGAVTPSVIYRAESTTHDIPPYEEVFVPVITDTLEALGYTDITEVPQERIAELRARGRVDIWRKVMNYVSFDYPYVTQGSQLNRDDVYASAQNQYNLAMNEWGGYSQVVEIPVQSSRVSTVKVVW